MKTLSIFTGAGGLDLGLEAAGFKIVGTAENDSKARQTILHNRPSWPLLELPTNDPGNLVEAKPKEVLSQFGLTEGELTLLSGGPPCQPFSKAGLWVNGKAGGLADPRAQTLHAFLGLIEVALPRFVLLENVRGIATAPNGKPELAALSFFQTQVSSINERTGANYRLSLLDLDSAQYGVPQHRRRLFVFLDREGGVLETPRQTHGVDAPSDSLTCWDAIGHLDDVEHGESLNLKGRWADLLPSIPEGHNYLWHTPRGGGEPLFGWRTRFWSFLLKLAKDRPSWTLQASPGPATGPFHWRNRLLSVEEMARIQTFPSEFEIPGSYSTARRQLGNAVPSAVGELLGLEIRRQIMRQPVRRRLRLIPASQSGVARKAKVASVPQKYLDLRAVHADHPGTGLGPAAQARELEKSVS